MSDLATIALHQVRAGSLASGLTMRQIALLGLLCDTNAPHRVRELASALQVQKPIITRACDRLLLFGFITRRRCGRDGREALIAPTPAGRAHRLQWLAAA